MEYILLSGRTTSHWYEDASIAYDPLSANCRFAGAADLAVLGTLVFAGATRHSISVMVPDCLLPPENNTVRVDARIGGRHDQLVAGGSFGACLVSGPSIGHTGAPASGILERVEPDFEEVEKRERQQVSGLRRGDQDQHGPPHPVEAHNISVFLAVPGAELFAVV